MRCDDKDADEQPESSYWTQKLFNFEANDSQRFVFFSWNSLIIIVFFIEIKNKNQTLSHQVGDTVA